MQKKKKKKISACKKRGARAPRATPWIRLCILQSTCFICTTGKRKQTLEQQPLFLVIAIITIAICYLCDHWNNNYCYNCRPSDMISYQISTLNFLCFCWLTSALSLPSPPTSRSGDKATLLSLLSQIVYFFHFLFYIIVQFFHCRFIWKSCINLLFIEFVFVMVKDTYLLLHRAYKRAKLKQKQNQVTPHSNWPRVLLFNLAHKQCNGIIKGWLHCLQSQKEDFLSIIY